MWDDFVNKYNNTVHRSIKMKPIGVSSDSYDEYKKDPRFKVGDCVRISKHKNIFAKVYTPKWSEVFAINEIKNTVPWTYAVSDLNCEKNYWNFSWKRIKTSQEKFIKEKVLKIKGDKLYVKWKGYDSRFNSWIDKKDLIPHIKMSYHFLKPFKSFGGNIDVKVDVSNYATKTDLKMLETLILQVLH